jgi:3-dehydroquinate dehydratase type I
MNRTTPAFDREKPQVVGSFGCLQDLLDCSIATAQDACDWIEVRLDILLRDGWQLAEKPWSHLQALPILFTARCASEGGVLPLTVAQRHDMLTAVIDDAAAIDIELAQHQEMSASIAQLHERQIPWIASMHHFQQMPAISLCRNARMTAAKLGASVFKLATILPHVDAMSELEDFQQETTDIAVATMGMGPNAPASRVRCALAGSVLNYGFIGQAPTAPGQWPAAALRQAIQQRNIPPLA